jgi:hypothetical protein
MSAYRKALAGALVTLAVTIAAAFGVDVPAELAAAAVTIVVFALGFVPLPEPPADEA